ncbi:MAG: cell division ATP-binding protein FtsE [Deltaproteobacteria bacterium]|nr:cell division ATP-binding protein FtsE [Deltaproteobacteria bacterium]
MIQFISVYKTYGQGITSLSNINLAIKKGEFVFITGASGSGKTTLLKLLYCEERPTSGQILINRQAVDSLKISEIPYLRRRIGIIFQDFKLLSERTIFDNVAIPLEVLGLPREEIVKRVQDVLRKVRLHHRMEEKVSSLSGGEQQKVAVGRAIINDPMILLVDEPTGSLDSGSGDEIMEILRSVNARGTTIVVATHNRSLIKEGRAVVLEKGRIVS